MKWCAILFLVAFQIGAVVGQRGGQSASLMGIVTKIPLPPKVMIWIECDNGFKWKIKGISAPGHYSVPRPVCWGGFHLICCEVSLKWTVAKFKIPIFKPFPVATTSGRAARAGRASGARSLKPAEEMKTIGVEGSGGRVSVQGADWISFVVRNDGDRKACTTLSEFTVARGRG